MLMSVAKLLLKFRMNDAVVQKQP